MIQKEIFVPEWLFKEEQAPNKKQIKKIYNPKIFQQLARKNNKLKDKELDKKLAQRMINPYYFFDEILKIGLKIIVKSHNFNHANSLLNIIPDFPDIGIVTKYNNKILNEMATYYARIINY